MKYGSCKHGGNLKSCPECNDISCDSTIKLMKENKIPTAKEMLNRVELLWLEESVEQDVLNFTLEFAKMHVKKALESAEHATNTRGIQHCYPLENIK